MSREASGNTRRRGCISEWTGVDGAAQIVLVLVLDLGFWADVESILWTGLKSVFCSEGTRPLLPRSAYTKQPRGFNPWSVVAEIRPETGGRSGSPDPSHIIPNPPNSGATFRAPFTNRLTQG